ncbi:carboxy terminal-processing peptidase [Thermogutta sp.]|uniref:carboxy terminal-processing peptidase n=1 Tax=Thermogutta sp. TaxID=1962930 RepID=UPI003C7D9804
MKLFERSYPRVPLILLWTGLLVLVSSISACGDPAGPRAQDRYIARTIAIQLPQGHLTKHPLDEEISRRAFKLFLKSLDPMKLYFYQSDVDRFAEKQDQWAALLKSGDISPAYEIFSVFLKRVDERVATALDILKQPLDFTKDEEIIRDPDLLTYPKTPEEARDRWEKRIKLDLLILKADKQTSGAEAIEKLQRRYTSFAKRIHQTDEDELLETYLSAICESYDPHTSYMSPETLENFDITMKLELEGIGAALQSEDGYVVVKRIIPGGPAAKDGRLKVDDKIIGVGQGEDGEIVDVVDMKLSDVVQLIRGKRGTVVRLEVLPADGSPKRIITITREKIELKDSEAKGQVFEVGQKPDGKPYRIGVIDLPSFYMDMSGARLGIPEFRSTTRDVRRILESFTQQGVDGVILDLRRNGGGSLQEAINLTGLFIESGPVVQVKDSGGRVMVYDDEDTSVAWRGPLIVLISKFSASASEILAGAIQDYRRGLIVGDHSTHGKGTVQSLIDLGQELFRLPNAPKLGALKLTIQQFYRPDGDSTQNRGVLADIELPSLTNHLEGISESDLDYALPFDRIQPAKYQVYSDVNSAVVDFLKKRSEERVNNSPDFQKVKQDIERYLAQREKKTVPLQEEKFMAQVKELNADKEEEKRLRALDEGSEEGIKRDYYLEEVFQIMTDYLQQRVVAQAR